MEGTRREARNRRGGGGILEGRFGGLETQIFCEDDNKSAMEIARVDISCVFFCVCVSHSITSCLPVTVFQVKAMHLKLRKYSLRFVIVQSANRTLCANRVSSKFS